VVLELIGAAEATAAGIVASQPHGCWGSIPHSVGQRKSVCRMANIRSRRTEHNLKPIGATRPDRPSFHQPLRSVREVYYGHRTERCPSQGTGAALVKAYRDCNYRMVTTARSVKPSSGRRHPGRPGDIADWKTPERTIPGRDPCIVSRTTEHALRPAPNGLEAAGLVSSLIARSLKPVS
jgi:hypothetical protein